MDGQKYSVGVEQRYGSSMSGWRDQHAGLEVSEAGLEVDVVDHAPEVSQAQGSEMVTASVVHGRAMESQAMKDRAQEQHFPLHWPLTDGEEGSDHDEKQPAEKRVLGFRPRTFCFMATFVAIVCCGAIGGGVGAGLVLSSRSQQEAMTTAAATTTTNGTGTGTPSPTASGTSPTAEAEIRPTPTDGGCPGINGTTHMPYSVDGKPLPIQAGLEAQAFTQLCYSRFVAANASTTNTLLRIYMPTLETCIMACAEYNGAYRANLNAGLPPGPGYCRAVSLAKEPAGFCYLKSDTGLNDTAGRAAAYSSAVLTTDTTAFPV